MPDRNDYVNYKAWGICKVEDIVFIKSDTDRDGGNYFILIPVFQKDSKIYVPADNQALTDKMSPILSAREIDDIIISVKNRNIPWIADRKQRLAAFQKILWDRNERELLMLISCLYFQSESRAKALSDAELRIMKDAETIIEQEFSFSLKIKASNIGEYIRQKLKTADIETVSDTASGKNIQIPG